MAHFLLFAYISLHYFVMSDNAIVTRSTEFIVLNPRDTVLKAALSRLMHICFTALVGIEIWSCWNILSQDKLTSADRFINRSALDNRISPFRVHSAVSYMWIYCHYRSRQAFHVGILRRFTSLLFIATSMPFNQIRPNDQKYPTPAITLKKYSLRNKKRVTRNMVFLYGSYWSTFILGFLSSVNTLENFYATIL